jgi:hypothetical protein
VENGHRGNGVTFHLREFEVEHCAPPSAAAELETDREHENTTPNSPT